jgi:hypothetical protein
MKPGSGQITSSGDKTPASPVMTAAPESQREPMWIGMDFGIEATYQHQPDAYAYQMQHDAYLAQQQLGAHALAEQPAVVHGPIIALDVDEVLVRYFDGFRKFLQREQPHGRLDTDYVFHEAHEPTSALRLQFALSGGLDNLEMVPGAAAALRKFKRAGIRLEAVTSRPPIMRESTEALLGRLFPPGTFSAAHFVGPGMKGYTCNSIGACVLVDDQLPNCIDACACGVLCVLFDFCGSYIWSQNIAEVPYGCQRIETWSDTCNYLLEKLGFNASERVPLPLELPSEMLLSVKQAAAMNVDTHVDVAEALSEAAQLPTEFDLDCTDRDLDVTDSLDCGQQMEQYTGALVGPSLWPQRMDSPRSFQRSLQPQPGSSGHYHESRTSGATSNIDEEPRYGLQRPMQHVGREPLAAWTSPNNSSAPYRDVYPSLPVSPEVSGVPADRRVRRQAEDDPNACMIL